MKNMIRLEWIGWNEDRRNHPSIQRKPWVKKIEAVNFPKVYGDFLRLEIDFTEANSQGSRGVYLNAILEYGYAYQIKQPNGWRKSKIWYAGLSESGEVTELTKDQIEIMFDGES